ncbi:unnamed protein product [Ilex paraguariensis]|uniref:RNA-dependent RNA polymerase n=1 Tax=Ilex paraguariensis TaxID=185542 RepID=A0ABC8TMH1_9AQUA
MIVDDEYIIIGSANINQRSMDGARDSEIAMGAYQPHHLATTKLARESLDCVQFVNRIADENWKFYSTDTYIGNLLVHLLRYPVEISSNGMIGTLPGIEFFPDTNAKILGTRSEDLPSPQNESEAIRIPQWHQAMSKELPVLQKMRLLPYQIWRGCKPLLDGKTIIEENSDSLLDIRKYFTKHMVNENLGTIWNVHVVHADLSEYGALDEKCIKLAELAATAVDFLKTGKTVTMPFELKPKMYPYFMEKEEFQSSKSEILKPF